MNWWRYHQLALSKKLGCAVSSEVRGFRLSYALLLE